MQAVASRDPTSIDRESGQKGEDFLARLKSETRPLHDSIEANPKFKRLMAEDLRLEEYSALLARLLPFHRRVEADLCAALAGRAEGLDVARRAKAPLIEADLVALGRFVAPVACGLALAPNAPAAWGTFYVLEGATLGGRVILKRLQATLGVDVGRGASYYGGYCAQTGAYWQAFRAALASVVGARPEWESPIIAAAGQTFVALDSWMAGA